MDNKEYIVCAGGANYDIHSKIQHALVMGDSNISHIYASAGGVVRNIAENLCKMGEHCVLLSAVGNDGFGQGVLLDSKNAGIDCSHVYIDNEHPTSVYLDILDVDGDMCLAANDMRILNYLPETYFDEQAELIKNSKAVIIDANLSPKHIEKICYYASKYGVKVFADTVSTIKCKVLENSFSSISFVKPNKLELAKLSGMDCNDHEDVIKAAAIILEKGVEEIAVSLGAEGCYYANIDGESFFMEAEPIDTIVSATGAGDSFMAGFVHAKLQGLSSQSCIDYAQKCGAKAIQSLNNIGVE